MLVYDYLGRIMNPAPILSGATTPPLRRTLES